MTIKTFIKKVGKHIANEAVSFIALLVSLGAMGYDALVEPVTIPTGQLSLTGGAGSAGGISLLIAGALVFAGVLAYGVYKAVKS